MMRNLGLLFGDLLLLAHDFRLAPVDPELQGAETGDEQVEDIGWDTPEFAPVLGEVVHLWSYRAGGRPKLIGGLGKNARRRKDDWKDQRESACLPTAFREWHCQAG